MGSASSHMMRVEEVVSCMRTTMTWTKPHCLSGSFLEPCGVMASACKTTTAKNDQNSKILNLSNQILSPDFDGDEGGRIQIQKLCYSSICSALQKVISTCSCVRNYALVRPTSSENDTISSWTASSIIIPIAQDGEFVVWPIVWEGEAFVVVILMRVFIVAYSLPILVIAVTLLHGGVNVVLGIACAATSFCALALGEVSLRRLV